MYSYYRTISTDEEADLQQDSIASHGIFHTLQQTGTFYYYPVRSLNWHGSMKKGQGNMLQRL